MKAQHKLAFPVLSDPGNAWAKRLSLVFTLPEDLRPIYTAFGLALPDFNGDDSWELPMPGRLIVDPRGEIREIEVHPDYTQRPEPDAILDALGAL